MREADVIQFALRSRNTVADLNRETRATPPMRSKPAPDDLVMGHADPEYVAPDNDCA